MSPRDNDHGERLARIEQEQAEFRLRHTEILTAIAASKADIMLHIDERFGGARRECTLRHEAIDEQLTAAKDAKKSGAQLKLQRWQIIAALIGTIFGASTTTTIVTHLLGKPAQAQAHHAQESKP